MMRALRHLLLFILASSGFLVHASPSCESLFIQTQTSRPKFNLVRTLKSIRESRRAPVTIIGNRHGSPSAEKAYGILIKKAQAGQIFLGLEGTIAGDTSSQRRFMQARHGEGTFSPTMFGLEWELPYGLAALAKGKVLSSHGAKDLEEFLRDALMDSPTLAQIYYDLWKDDAFRNEPRASLFAQIANRSRIRGSDGFRLINRAESFAILYPNERVEQMNSQSADFIFSTLLAAVAEKAPANKIAEINEIYPEFPHRLGLLANLNASVPFSNAIQAGDEIIVELRNRVFVKVMQSYVRQASKEGKPLYVFIGSKHTYGSLRLIQSQVDSRRLKHLQLDKKAREELSQQLRDDKNNSKDAR